MDLETAIERAVIRMNGATSLKNLLPRLSKVLIKAHALKWRSAVSRHHLVERHDLPVGSPLLGQLCRSDPRCCRCLIIDRGVINREKAWLAFRERLWGLMSEGAPMAVVNELKAEEPAITKEIALLPPVPGQERKWRVGPPTAGFSGSLYDFVRRYLCARNGTCSREELERALFTNSSLKARLKAGRGFSALLRNMLHSGDVTLSDKLVTATARTRRRVGSQ